MSALCQVWLIVVVNSGWQEPLGMPSRQFLLCEIAVPLTTRFVKFHFG